MHAHHPLLFLLLLCVRLLLADPYICVPPFDCLIGCSNLLRLFVCVRNSVFFVLTFTGRTNRYLNNIETDGLRVHLRSLPRLKCATPGGAIEM